MSIDPIKAPLYNAWSNEGGGRDIEMAYRQSTVREKARMREERDRAIVTTTEGFVQATIKFDALNQQLAQKYDAEGLRRLAEPFRGVSSQDLVTLSPEAKDFLRDHSAFAEARKSVAFLAREAATVEAQYNHRIAMHQTWDEHNANLYDANFTKDDGERLAAYKRFLAADERMRSGEFSTESGRRADGTDSLYGPFAPPAEFKKDQSGLFAVDARGNIKVNAKDLEKLGPEQQAIEALKRLALALTENNGLNQLRDGLIAALDGQNRTIADKAAALTAATKPDATSG